MIVTTLLLLGSLSLPTSAAACASGLAGSALPAAARSGEAAHEVVLLTISGASLGRSDLDPAVAGLDESGLLALLRLLAAGQVAIQTGSGRTRFLTIGVEQRRILLDSIASLPRKTWLAAMDRLDPYWDGPASRIVMLELLARGGTTLDLQRFERATDLGDEPAPPELRAATRAALVRLLGTSANFPWRKLWKELPGPLLTALLDALEQTRRAEFLDALCDCLGVRPAADALVLDRVERLLHSSPQAPRPSLVQEARRCLLRSDTSTRLHAMRILGLAGDVEVLEDLAPLLSAADAESVLDARAAMRRIAGDDLGPLPGPWLEWLQSERTWLAERGPELQAQLSSGSDAEAVAALRELGRHRIDRAWRARSAALALGREPADLLVLACQALERFGTRAEHAALLALCQHADERVRNAAQRAADALVPPLSPAG